ncbi:MAG: PHP domain-containing protein [Cyanobacteria bacterium P01_H01_bin.15]
MMLIKAPVIAQDTDALKEAWKTVTWDSCPKTYNFHMHTVFSDGQMQPETLLEQAIAIGLKGLAITDHHSVQGNLVAQAWLDNARREQPDVAWPYLWMGIEITTNLDGTDVHTLGYGFDPNHPAIKGYCQGKGPSGVEADAETVVAAIHAAGGLVVLAHPFRYRRPPSELVPLAVKIGYDGIEAFYAYGNPKPWRASSERTEQALEFADMFDLYTTCGTDTHGTSLLRRV